jgi:kynureninase
VDYRSGARADLRGVTDAVHAAGGLMLWDLSHAVGSVAIDLEAAGADLATGCTYKYVAGGPGAPAFLYVRGEILPDLPPPPLQGWFGADDQFAMGPVYAPAPGIARFMAGTPPIISMAAIGPGRRPARRGGHGRGRPQGRAAHGAGPRARRRVARAARLHGGDAPGRGRARRPRRPAPSRRVADLPRAHRARRVVPDFRRPDVVRFGFPALSTSFADVWDACDRLRALVAAGGHEQVDAAPRRVT